MILTKYYIDSDFFEFSINDLNFIYQIHQLYIIKNVGKTLRFSFFLFWINFSVSGFLFLNKIYKMGVKNIFLPKIF